MSAPPGPPAPANAASAPVKSGPDLLAVPSLEQFYVASSEGVTDEQRLTVDSKLRQWFGSARPFQSRLALSRRHQPLLSEQYFFATPIVDGERALLLLDASLGAVLALLESGELVQLSEAALLLSFALNAAFVFDGVFVFNSKRREYVFLVADALLANGVSLCGPAGFRERRVVVTQFCEFFRQKCKEVINFEIQETRLEPLFNLPKLVSLLLWHQEANIRVFVENDDLFPALGFTLFGTDHVYVCDRTNEFCFDWYYPNMFPFFVLIKADMESRQLSFEWDRGVPCGRLVLNSMDVVGPVLAQESGSCIAKMMFDPSKGIFVVRNAYKPGKRALSTAGQVTLALLQSNEIIRKEDLLHWAQTLAKKQ